MASLMKLIAVLNLVEPWLDELLAWMKQRKKEDNHDQP